MPLYLHGVPDQLRRLARRSSSAPAASRPTCPASGARASPATCDYTIDEYDRFIERFLDARRRRARAASSCTTGAPSGLAFAQRQPERDRAAGRSSTPCRSCPATAGTARRASGARPCSASWRWARPRRCALRLLSRESNATPGPMPEAWLDSVLDHFDQGTQRAILRLYRSSPPEVLAAAGARLGELTMPALVRVGHARPLHPRALRRASTRDALPHAELLELPDAGHWRVARPPRRDRARGGLPERRRERAAMASPRRRGRRTRRAARARRAAPGRSRWPLAVAARRSPT